MVWVTVISQHVGGERGSRHILPIALHYLAQVA
jgi:hypothetical protein